MKTKTLNGIIIFCMGILTACILLGGTIAFQNRIYYNSINNVNLYNGELICANLSLEDTANCLNNELNKWWKYNVSNVYAYWKNKEIDWDTIKKEGGVCWHSSEWYNQQAKSLGFETKMIDFGENYSHELILLYNKNMSGYCILDQKVKPTCVELGVINE